MACQRSARLFANATRCVRSPRVYASCTEGIENCAVRYQALPPASTPALPTGMDQPDMVRFAPLLYPPRDLLGRLPSALVMPGSARRREWAADGTRSVGRA